MSSDSFYEEQDSRVLTDHAFEFILAMELKRAVRSRDFLTFLMLETERDWEGMTFTADVGTRREVAQIVGSGMRSTDLLGRTGTDGLAILLLDCGFDDSVKVIDRMASRIEDYQFLVAIRVAVGAACYPADATDIAGLKRHARMRPVLHLRGHTGHHEHFRDSGHDDH